MGKYTVLDDPVVDQTIEDHLQQIVAAIRSRIEPQAIILRGSFSRGEGSVVIEGNRLFFLSDYEVVAITPHYRDRLWVRRVARQMTAQLGVETSIARAHPHALEPDSQGNYGGLAQPTISMYEVQIGGLTLYGEHLLNRGTAIDPRTVSISSGLRLLLNRMAESMDHLPSTTKNWKELRWVNKTILACAEALLTVHRQYHYSYAERGCRFTALVPELDPVVARASHLPDLVCRATAFKLRPSLDLYPESMPLLWQLVRQACDATFRYVVEKHLGFSFDSYAEFPEHYLNRLRIQNKKRKNRLWLLPVSSTRNLLLILEFLHAGRWPPLKLIKSPLHSAKSVVYAIVPLLFIEESDEVLQEARYWLEMLGRLEPPCPEHQAEQAYLRHCIVQAWKDFCYGK